MAETSLLVQVLTIAGPVAAIALFAIYINWQLVIHWSNERKANAEAYCKEREAYILAAVTERESATKARTREHEITIAAWSQERVEVYNTLIAAIVRLEDGVDKLVTKLQ